MQFFKILNVSKTVTVDIGMMNQRERMKITLKLKQKFFVLAGLSGLLMATVSMVSYINANNTLEKSVEQQLTSVVDAQAKQLDGWLQQNASVATSVANLMTSLNGDRMVMERGDMLSLADGNKDILEVGVGMENGFFQGRQAGNKTGILDPRTRDWYKNGKNAEKTVFTEAYVDKFTSKLVTSAVSPFKNNGSFAGTIFVDIALDTLDEEATKIQYEGHGTGYIIEKSGKVLASTSGIEKLADMKKIPGIGAQSNVILSKERGFFEIPDENGNMVFAYQSVPSTGWVVAISVPSDYVYAPVNRLRLIFGVITLVGLALMIAMCLKFSLTITSPVTMLERRARELSGGNLCFDEIPIHSNDEIGSLATEFNTMAHNLRTLIKKMASTSEQVAAASEELTANAQQSADAAVHVAETVGSVNEDVEQQLSNVKKAKGSVDTVFNDIENMSKEAGKAVSSSHKAADVAKIGANLMENALHKMGDIEKSVLASAEVVRKLGENSKQIGQIVESITAIAEQTNLLSLNAAIEAARAGEQGKGFAVVADEVRKLAQESHTSAEQIRNRIMTIQEETQHAVESMDSGTHEVQNGSASIREVGEQFNSILKMVEEIQGQMDKINSSVSTVTEGATLIVSSMDLIQSASKDAAESTQSISAATEEQSASNEEIAAASQSLAKLAEEMQIAVGKFKF